MRSIISVSATALFACTLQCCQTAEKTGSATAEIPNPVRSAIASPPEQNMRLKTQARAYAERLNQGRCGMDRERTEFDNALTAVESSLAAAADTQIASEAERVVAEARLDVADAARNGGCSEIANAQYKTIVRTFRGPAFAKYRNQAEIGLSAMQL